MGAAGALRAAHEALLREGDTRAATRHTVAMVMAKRRRRRQRPERDTGTSGKMMEILGY